MIDDILYLMLFLLGFCIALTLAYVIALMVEPFKRYRWRRKREQRVYQNIGRKPST